MLAPDFHQIRKVLKAAKYSTTLYCSYSLLVEVWKLFN